MKHLLLPGHEIRQVFALPFETRREAEAGLKHVMATSPAVRDALISTANPEWRNLMDDEEFLAVYLHLTTFSREADDPDIGGAAVRLPRAPFDPVLTRPGGASRTFSEVTDELRRSGEWTEQITYCHPPRDPEEELLRRLDSAGR